MNVELNIESGAGDVVAKGIIMSRFLNCALEDLHTLRKFSRI